VFPTIPNLREGSGSRFFNLLYISLVGSWISEFLELFVLDALFPFPENFLRQLDEINSVDIRNIVG